MKILFKGLFVLGVILVSEVNAIDYSWNSASQSAWATPGNWSPNGSPGSLDNILTATQFGSITMNVASAAVNNWTHDSSSSHTILGLNGAGGSALTINGILSKAGASTLTFRDGSNNPLNLSIGQLTATGGTIRFGTFNSAAERLTGLTIGSADITNATVEFNVVNGSNNTSTITNNLAMAGTSTLSLVQRVGETGILSVGSLSSTDTTTLIRANSFSASSSSVATLVLNNASGSTTYAGRIATSANPSVGDEMNVIKNGAGTQIFTGINNSYNGATTINGGTLLINNASGSGTGTGVVQVNTAGRFGGTGSASGAVTVASGGRLLGGAEAATGALTLSGDLTLQDGSVLQLALGGSGAHSSFIRSGSGNWTFDADQAFLFIDQGAELGTYTNLITGLAGDPGSVAGWTIQNAGWSGFFSYNGSGGIDLTLSAIPEPSTYAMLGLGLGTLWFSRRKKFE